jgi:hypothetical protein
MSASSSVNITELIDRYPLGSSQIRIIVLCGLVALLEGFDLLAIGVAAPAMAGPLHIAPRQFGFIFSAALFGLMLGAFGLRPIADRYGRRCRADQRHRHVWCVHSLHRRRCNAATDLAVPLPRRSRFRRRDGKVLVEEPDTPTTVLVSSVKFLNGNRELAKKFWQAHRELTDWVLQHPADAQSIVQAELLAETRTEISGELIALAWKRINFTSEIPRASVEAFVTSSQKAGFMRSVPDLSRLFETP